MTKELSIEEMLIERYRNWLFLNIPSPYNESKWEWIKEVNLKIEELKKKLK